MKVVNDQVFTLELNSDDRRRAEIVAEDRLSEIRQTAFTQMEVRNLMAEFFLKGQLSGARDLISQNSWVFGSKTFDEIWKTK